MGLLSSILSAGESGKEMYRKQLEVVLRNIEWEKDQIAKERKRIADNKKNPSVVNFAKGVIEQRKKTIEQKKQQAAKLRECIKMVK